MYFNAIHVTFYSQSIESIENSWYNVSGGQYYCDIYEHWVLVGYLGTTSQTSMTAEIITSLLFLFSYFIFIFQFKLSPMVLGLMFVINGGTYALTAPWWGWLCDKVLPAKVVTLLGCIILMIGFSLIGPVPFLNRPT